MTRTADVVIVGAGTTGLSIAFHLAIAGPRNVVVLERRFIGAGGTGRSVGIIRQLYPTRETTAMVMRSLAVYRDFDAVVGGASGYVRCGALIGVSPEMRAPLEQTMSLQRSLGVRAELLAPSDVARIEPRIDTSRLGAVLHEPDSGYADPSGVAAAYAAAARRRGVTVEQDTEVISVGVAGGRVTGVELPIVIGRHPVFVIERDASFGAPHPVFLDLAGGSYVRPESGGLTLTGSLTDDETGHPMDPERLGAEVGLEEAADVLERTGRALPRLADARYRGGWVGAFDITPDWMPILDESPVRGFWIAAGMSGHGFKLAPAVGEMMADLIIGRTPPVSPEPFRLERFATSATGGTFVASYLR